MAIRRITVDGQPCADGDTEEDFAKAMDSGFRIFQALREVIAAFGVPAADEHGDPIDIGPLRPRCST
ncbi:MAG: hypothetical protein F4174_11235 [Acidobacteria bacterium]|nr:hypothetical protein [Acidobacteriota bacterium]